MYGSGREKHEEAESKKVNLWTDCFEFRWGSRDGVFVHSRRAVFFPNHPRYEGGLGSVFPENGAGRKKEVVLLPVLGSCGIRMDLHEDFSSRNQSDS
jgi:hypothetical protein